MDPIVILQAGVATGTVLLFATLCEVFAERSGVLNLGPQEARLRHAHHHSTDWPNPLARWIWGMLRWPDAPPMADDVPTQAELQKWEGRVK